VSVIENKKIVNKFISSVLNQQNLDVLNDLAATTVVAHVPGADLTGRDALNEHLAQRPTPSSPIRVDDEIADDDKVVLRLSSGDSTGISVFRIQGGQIAELWDARIAQA
jgi:predicted SnoaL-like aldol condensation-catalyzing enzyme